MTGDFLDDFLFPPDCTAAYFLVISTSSDDDSSSSSSPSFSRRGSLNSNFVEAAIDLLLFLAGASFPEVVGDEVRLLTKPPVDLRVLVVLRRFVALLVVDVDIFLECGDLPAEKVGEEVVADDFLEEAVDGVGVLLCRASRHALAFALASAAISFLDF